MRIKPSGTITNEVSFSRDPKLLWINVNVEYLCVLTTQVTFSDNYSMYSLEIHLTRFVSPYLLNVYLPTGIFVLMSWISFFIPAKIIAARITLLITICLVLINSFNDATERIPVAREETAMEYWICGCIGLVFAALGEYAFILFKVARIRRAHRKSNREGKHAFILLHYRALFTAEKGYLQQQ